MKKNIKYASYALILVIAIGFFIVKTNQKPILEKLTTSELRSTHEQFLQNSPFKKSLHLSKKERKSLGLPPNKYYERDWELTMNPATGLPEPGKIFAIQKERNSIKGKAPGDGTAGNDWIERGPNNVGGRTRVVLFDPNDTTNKRVFAGGVSGGLWVNEDITNANLDWTLVSGVPSNMNISCITVDPNDSDVWYIGTGEQYTAGAAVGNGVFKTEDGGDNWTNVPIQLAGSGTIGNYFAGIYFINGIVAWNNAGNTEIFIGIGTHIYGDSSNPTDWLGFQNAGLYKSTNNGTNWNRIETTALKLTSTSSFYTIPNDFEISADNTLWFGTIRTPGTNDGGGKIFYSTDGSTWTEAAASPLSNSNRVELAVSSTDASKMYALTEGTTNAGPHIFASTDAFTTVTELAKPVDSDPYGTPANDFTRGQAFYNLVIEVDPTNDNVVYVGGIDIFRTDQGENVNETSDWKQISQWWDQSYGESFSYAHADQHAFTFRPGNTNEAVIGCDGGVYYASNLSIANTTNTIIGARNNNYNVTQFYSGGYGQDISNELIIAGAQDNGSQFINGASAGINSSVAVDGGDGAYSTIQNNGDYMISSYIYNYHRYYPLPYTGNWYLIDDDQDEGDFITPGALDHNLNILFTDGSEGVKQINRYILGTTNAAKTQLTNTLLNGSPTAFKVSPFTTASTTLLVGTDQSKLLKLSNANEASENIVWEDITGSSFVGSISAVEFGETENDIFVTFYNYGVNSVWFTSNGGVTWENKEGNLPDMPVRSILQNPLARNEVMIGTDLGIWVSKNFNEESPIWVSSFNGMSDVKVNDLDLRTADNSILATTFGRGVFTGKFTSETNSTFTISTENSVVEACAPDDVVFTFDFTALGGYSSKTTFLYTGGPEDATLDFSVPSLNSTGIFTLTVGNISAVATGEYIITVTGTGGGKTIATDVVLTVNEATVEQPITLTPINEATGVPVTSASFTWNEISAASSYEIEIATDAGFNTIIETGTTENNTYTNSVVLNLGTSYFWRVKALNTCVSSEFSETKSFQTASENSCNILTNNTTEDILDGVEVYSIINVPNNFSVSNVNVSVDITHSYISDMIISLISPEGTEIILFNRECAAQSNFEVWFSDQALEYNNCINSSGIIKPANPLSGFINESSMGDWKLSIYDGYTGDTGTLNNWSLEICESETSTNSTIINNGITVAANSIYTFTSDDIEASSAGSTPSEQQFMITEIPTIGALKLSNTTLLLGETFTQNDIDTNKLTYVNTSSVSASDSFKATITNATGGFVPNEVFSITIDESLSVSDDLLAKSGISIFPAISNGNFSIASTKAIGKTSVEIYAMNGQQVYASQFNFNSGTIERIDAGKLASGIYILKLNAGTIQGSKKIVIK